MAALRRLLLSLATLLSASTLPGTQRWAGGRCSRTSGIAKRRIRGTQQRHQGRNTKIRCQSPGRFDYMSEIEADPVLYSCLQMAAVRGLESRYPNPLFEDDLSCKLAGDKANAEAESIFRRSKNKLGRKISVRTRFFDDLARDALREKNIKQVVVLGSGMDTRFYRLNLHNEKQEEVDGDGNNGKVNYLSWIELDLSQVLVAKESLLSNALGENDRTRRYQRYRHHHHGEVRRWSRGCDLSTTGWSACLKDTDFDPRMGTLWIMEGLLMYLEPADVNRLIRDIAKLSSGNSMIGASVVNTDSLTSAQISSSRLQNSWRWGVDDPKAFLSENLGPQWSINVVTMGQAGCYPQGANYGVWTAERVVEWRRKGRTMYIVAQNFNM